MGMREHAAQRLGQAIARERSTIERQWLDQVQRDVVTTPGVALTQLRNGMPHYLDALVKVLATGQNALDRSARSAWQDVASEHGITRVRIGFDIGQLVHEFIVLRHVIRGVIKDELGGPDSEVEGMLADVIEAAVSAAVQAYVDARDHELRRTQAENIGFLTHELRNPLSTAVLAATQLRRHAAPMQGPVLDSLDRGLGKLADLIDSVLLTQNLEAGKVRVRPVPIALGEIIEPSLEASRRVAEQKQLSFRVSFDGRLHVELDPLLTRSAIQNLVDNAVKFTDVGGVELGVEDLGERFRLHLRDSCAGISPQELRTIFEPFERGHSGKAGTGLGLAIARRAVEAQGGSIHAESSGTHGCHFWIDLPKRAKERDD
jgi:signal transduction histidine kinase